jgi:hypothetical protein
MNIQRISGTDHIEMDSQANLDMKAILRDAQISTDIPQEMESLRNFYLNDLLKL